MTELTLCDAYLPQERLDLLPENVAVFAEVVGGSEHPGSIAAGLAAVGVDAGDAGGTSCVPRVASWALGAISKVAAPCCSTAAWRKKDRKRVVCSHRQNVPTTRVCSADNTNGRSHGQKPGTRITGIEDSKKLDSSSREALAEEIKEKAAAWCVAFIDVEEIDTINITGQACLRYDEQLKGCNRFRSTC